MCLLGVIIVQFVMFRGVDLANSVTVILLLAKKNLLMLLNRTCHQSHPTRTCHHQSSSRLPGCPRLPSTRQSMNRGIVVFTTNTRNETAKYKLHEEVKKGK